MTDRTRAILLVSENPGATATMISKLMAHSANGALLSAVQKGILLRKRMKNENNPYLGQWVYFPNPDGIEEPEHRKKKSYCLKLFGGNQKSQLYAKNDR